MHFKGIFNEQFYKNIIDLIFTNKKCINTYTETKKFTLKAILFKEYLLIQRSSSMYFVEDANVIIY